MPADTLLAFVEYAIRTAIFFVLLGLLIKVQRFDRRFQFKFSRLLGAAALVVGLYWLLHQGLGPSIGFRRSACIAAPIAFFILWYSVKRITRADYVETFYTVVVSAGLMLAIKLFFLGTLAGQLHTFAHHLEELVQRAPPGSQKQNLANHATNAAASGTNPAVVRATANSPKPALTNGAETGASASDTGDVVATPVPPKPVPAIFRSYIVTGVTRNGANSAVTIQAGARTYTLFLGESVLTQTPQGPVSVRFSDLGRDAVTLEINGEAAKFPIP